MLRLMLAVLLGIGALPRVWSAEVRDVSVRPLSALVVPHAEPLDVRDAALPIVLFPQAAPVLEPAQVPAAIEIPRPQAALGGATLSALQDSPVAAALQDPRADPAAAMQDLFDRGASRVALLDGALEAIDARATMIGDAKRSVFAAYYRFHMDAAGYSKLAMLRQAARRGRDVRLVLDPWGSGIPKAMLKHLIEQGVQIRYYHKPKLSRLSWLWKRSHDKWTIVDGESAVLGDRNMGAHYFGMGDAPWTSREVFVEGKVAAQADSYARQMWRSREVSAPRGLERVPESEIAKWSAKLDRYEEHFERRKERGEFKLKQWTHRTRTIEGAKFSHNYFGLRRGVSGTGLDLLRMIRGAEKTIVIENAYIVLPQVFKLELERAIKRGVRVVMLTNSPKTNNLFSARSAYEADIPMLIRMGVELWEFYGPGTLHAKVMVVDGKKAYLGSFNLDPRSLRLNTETGIVADDADLARDMLWQIRRTQENSALIGFGKKLLIPRRNLPIVGRLWALWRAVLLMFFRDQV